MADKNQKIIIPIGECDIESMEKLVHANYDPFVWTFESNEGESIDVIFAKQEHCPLCGDLAEPVLTDKVDEAGKLIAESECTGGIHGES